MPSTKLDIALVIPAYNEEKNIKDVLLEVVPLVNEVIVVDDGSRDHTSEIARECGATLLRHVTNRGQGAALRTGTHYAESRGHGLIVHFDADGQFRKEDLPAIIAPLMSGESDIVFGSRFLNHQTKMPFIKKNLIMPLARLVNQALFGIKLTDPQSGYRGFTLGAARQLEWRQDGMAHCTEILALAHKNKLRIKEVPITIIYHEYGQRLSGGFKIIKDLLLGRLLK